MIRSRSVVKFVIFVITFVLVSLSGEACTPRSALVGVNKKHYQCDPSAGEQMVKIPGWKGAWQVVEDCSIARPEHVGVAMKVFYLHWLETFGDRGGRVKANLEKIVCYFCLCAIF